MRKKIIACVLMAFLPAFVAFGAAAQTTVDQLVDTRLRAGELKDLSAELSARLTQTPADNEARFALGATQFLIAVEHLSQSMYRYGLEPTRASTNMPFLRFPVPVNPKPEQLTYEKMREVFQNAVTDFAAAETTLAALGKEDVKLRIAIGLARLDLDGDGKATENETLWRVFDATLGGGNFAAQQAERFIVSFDRGDAAWLRGYGHLLGAILEFMLAHDWHEGFDASFHTFFPKAGLPFAVLNDYRSQEWGFDSGQIADLIAFIHLAHWPVVEPARMTNVLAHLESMASLSRESWTFILAETDDDAEWIPNPAQKAGVLPGLTVTAERVAGWMTFLDEFDALLKGKKLIPHWRLAKGINLRRVFTEPKLFDPVLWVQGSAALPYVEDGPLTTSETWMRIIGLLEGNFLCYALWFN